MYIENVNTYYKVSPMKPSFRQIVNALAKRNLTYWI